MLTTLALMSFWIWDTHTMPPGFRRPEFELKQIHWLADKKTQLNFWVETELEPRPSEEALATLFSALTTKKSPEGSLDPEASVLDIERKYLGEPPKPPSGDRTLNVVVGNIPPFKRQDGTQVTFDGFFNAFDQLSEATAMAKYKQHSNERNIVYVNSGQNLASQYMAGVVVHELAHLIVHGRDSDHEDDAWFNEMIGEAAMQMTGYFSDAALVDRYRVNTTGIPVIGSEYASHYGAVSMFAEYLLSHYPPENFSRLVHHHGNAIDRIQVAYGDTWNGLFADYVRWLYEQDPPTRFAAKETRFLVAEHERINELQISPTGVAYVKERPNLDELAIARVPAACASSTNMLRMRSVKSEDRSAYALWIESTPPCPASWDKKLKRADPFVVGLKYPIR